ncbi:MAG: NAD(P)H-hydrate dehydratase [bacterium]|nr:NAD(P)H-hydrate dehydratase [bacterium]
MKLLYAQWMQELDAQTINGIGIPSIVLMENASRGAADFFAEVFPLPRYKNVIVVAGKGNNGGDGFAAGRILFQKGYHTEFILLSNPGKLNPDPKINFDILNQLNLHVTIVENEKELHKMTDIFSRYDPSRTFVMDALFGTGLNNPVKPGFYSSAIDRINSAGFKVAAIDIPSGLSDQFFPEEAVHINADVTATFQSLKTAHLHPDGNKSCGEIRVIDIGIPHHLVEQEKYYIRMIEPRAFSRLLGERTVDAHKGSYGHILTVCGSIEKPGAGILSSYSVLKSGAGLCTAAVSVENRTVAITAHPELMTLVYKNGQDLLKRLPQFNAVLVGPGLGDNPQTTEFVSLMLEKADTPLVLDADALNALHREDRKTLLKRKRHYPVVITPHPGEFSRLTGLPVPEIRKNRIRLSRDFASEFNVYVVLKGHHTLIATPGGRVFVNQTGNPGMATAGSGDVLGGMITGMVSRFTRKGTPPAETLMETILQAAVFIHGYAGDLAASEVGEISLTAGDIIDYIPRALGQFNDYQSPFQFSR